MKRITFLAKFLKIGLMVIVENTNGCKKIWLINGRVRSRTGDLSHAKRTRYQLRHTPCRWRKRHSAGIRARINAKRIEIDLINQQK